MQRVIWETQTLNIPQPVFKNMLQSHINHTSYIIKVYQQYYEHMGHKVITVGANG